MESNTAALANPALYVESHPSVLPPLVTWTGLLLIKRLWLPWLVLTLPSLAFIVWLLLRRQGTRWIARLIWINVVILLGPFGLLAYLLVQRRHRFQGERLGE